LDHAFTAWSSYFKNVYYGIICGTQSADACLGTYDTTQSYWSDTSVDNANRSWLWIVCNEVGFLQESAPEGYPSIVSRTIQPDYDLRQCHQMFPDAFTPALTVSAAKSKIEATNALYKGWDVEIPRLFFANGRRDPWKEATTAATNHTIPFAQQPVVVADGFHCSDLGTSAAIVDPTIAALQKVALGFMSVWLAEWSPPGSWGGYSYGKATVGVGSRAVDSLEVKPINAFAKNVGTL